MATKKRTSRRSSQTSRSSRRSSRKHGDSAKLSVADAHQLRILKDTVRNPLKGQFLGGPSAEEAERTLRSKFRLTSEQIRKLRRENAAMAPEITMAEAVTAYRDGNNRGAGYAPYTDEPGDDTIEEAVACAERDGWTLVLDRTNSETVAVLRNGDGELMAIGGDASGRRAWAVDLPRHPRAHRARR